MHSNDDGNCAVRVLKIALLTVHRVQHFVSLFSLCCILFILLFCNFLLPQANAPSMGLSTLSLYTELIMFTHAALYGVLNGHPLLTYGDAFSQAIQTAVVIILVAMGTATLPSTVPKLGLAFAYFTAVYHFLPADLIPWLIRGNLVFVSIARGSQIIKNFGGKKGAQSTFTTFCQAAGTGVKLFTTTQEIGFDFNLLSAYLAGFVLNTILLVQIASSDDSEAPAKKKSTNGSSNGANGHVEKISTRQSSQSRADIRSRKAQKTREDREFDEVKPRRNTPRKARTPLAR